MGFLLKFLLITFGVLYLLGFMFRWVLKKLYKNFQSSAGNYNSTGARPADGNVKVDYVPPKDKKGKNFRGGDYIEYEEIK